MEKQAQKLQVGDAVIYKGGDPRPRQDSFDEWLNGLLHSVSHPKARVNLYGSDAGFCARRNVLLANNTFLADETTAASNAYMSIGVALEEMLMKAMADKDVLVGWNVHLLPVPEIKVRGKMDLLFFNPDDQLTLMEVKSCGALPTEPKPNHLAQAQTYAAFSGIRNVVITYISRQVNLPGAFGPHVALRTFQVDTSDEALLNRFHIALTSARLSVIPLLPPVPAHFRKHTECHYCEFRDLFCYQPRPGLEVSVQPPPLPEADASYMILLERKVAAAAQELLAKVPYLELQTLDFLKEKIRYEMPESRMFNMLERLHQEKLDTWLTVKGGTAA